MFEEYTSLTEQEAKTFVVNQKDEPVKAVMAERVGDATVLDVGCANGYDADRYGNNYTGLDISEELIKHAKLRHPDKTFICKEVREYFKEDVHYDYIVCKSVLEHTPSLEIAQEIYKLMIEHCDVLLVAWAMIPHNTYKMAQTTGHFGKTIWQNWFKESAFALPNVSISKKKVNQYSLWTVTKV